MKDIKRRISNLPEPVGFRWGRALRWLLLSLLMIGNWVFALGVIAISQMTRGSVELLDPPNSYVVISTFIMLAGVVLLSIQLVSVVNHVMHGNKPPDH